MIKNGCGWPVLPQQQPARAIEVGEDRIEQLCSLHQARLEPGPLLIVNDERQRIEPPLLRGSQVCRGRRGWPEIVDAGLGVYVTLSSSSSRATSY